MDIDYKPKVQVIKVRLEKLLLWPSNPRFNDHKQIEEERWPERLVQRETSENMKPHGVDEIMSSIRINGWSPVDRIFVRKHRGTDNYVVLEGNRRVTALQELVRVGDLRPEIASAIDPLEVVEVLGEEGSPYLNHQISYLLGVRHHGSLKQWSPFAQAHNIFRKYCRVAACSPEAFTWNADVGAQVGETLGMKRGEVEKRLKVYCVMKQLDEHPDVKSAGGMKHGYYTITDEPLGKGKDTELGRYFPKDPSTFRLNEEGIGKMLLLCRFDKPNRKGAPIRNQREWRSYEKILTEPDKDRRREMLVRVNKEGGEHPSAVYAERAAELSVPRWDTWLEELNVHLRSWKMDDLESTNESIQHDMKRMNQLLEALGAGDQ